MPYAPRNFTANNVYELTFRARKGFPLPPKRLIKALLKGVLARTQRDFKVHICHLIWMANHPHIIIIIKDAEAAKCFYAELKKKLTDSLKAMLGFNYLHLWEPRPNVSRLRYFEDVMAKIAYVYANPSRADLVDSIEEYPGYSSYDDFRNCPNQVEAKVSELVPWIQHSRLGRVPALLSDKTDAFLTKKYLSEAKKKHMLIVEPNLWMKCFGISDMSRSLFLDREFS